MPRTPSPSFRLGSMVLPVYLPGFLFSLGTGAILPVIPALASSLGAGLALAGFIAGLFMIGELIGDLPAGALVARFGERRAMLVAAAVASVGMVICFLATGIPLLGVGVLLTGMAATVFALARHSFMTSFVPLSHRARALSTLGGTFRAGGFIGPLLGALAIHLTGATGASFGVAIATFAITAIVVAVLPDPSETLAAHRGAHGASDHDGRGVLRTIVHHRGVLLRLGTGAMLIAALRSSRQVILPLWAVSLAFPETTTSIVIGIAGGLDFALFYTGGWIMDRFGRAATAIPTMIGLGLGHLALVGLLFWPHPLSGFVAVALLLSVANGVGSGILMTLGADLAPPGNPTPFLAAWRLQNDLGQASAPLAISGLTAIWSLAGASAVLGGLGLLGAVLLMRYLPRYVVHGPSQRRPAEVPPAADPSE